MLKNYSRWRCWRLCSIISFLLISYQSVSQSVTVKDADTKEGIPFVYVTRSDTTKAVTANKNGVVDLSGYLKKELIIFHHSSYESLIGTKFRLVKDGVVYLKPKNSGLPSIEIEAPFRSIGTVDHQPMPMEVLDMSAAQKLNPLNTAEVLENSGNINVQRSQGGGGSPVIRGFEANKILLVVDGIRMNNAIYRSGHLQNAITLDHEVMDKIDVHYGPSSVLYGSDAIGGVLHFKTKNPEYLYGKTKKKVLFNGSSDVSYATNGNSFNGHFDFNLGFRKFAMITSVSASKFGDIKMGNRRSHGDSTWGLWNHYVSQVNGIDSTFVNEDNRVQIGSGYTQLDVLNKMAIKLGDRYELSTNFQYSLSSNINRSDILDQYSGNNLKWAEWYYGPQQRILGALKLDIKSGSTLFHRASLIASYQNVKESRINRRFGEADRTVREEQVQVLGLNMDMVREIDSSKVFNYGFELSYNDVGSDAFTQNIFNGLEGNASTRYPNGTNHYFLLGAYVSYKHKFSHKLLLMTGLRYTHIVANSTFSQDDVINLPYESIKFNKGAVSGNLGLFYRPSNGFDIKVAISSGFRAPNIDDYGKVFEKNGFVVVPNENLKPEYALNGDIGIVKRFGWKKLVLEANLFYTHLFDAIVRQDAQLHGQDSVLYDGEMGRVQTNVNASQAFVTGINFKYDWLITRGMHFYGTFNYTRGWNITDGTNLSHIPPIFGKVGLSYTWKKLSIDVFTRYNAVKPIKEYGPGSTDNFDEALSYTGTPAWATLNASLSYRMIKKMTIRVGFNNILNQHYRQFSSGISAPGFNFIVKLKYQF